MISINDLIDELKNASLVQLFIFDKECKNIKNISIELRGNAINNMIIELEKANDNNN